LALAGVLLSPRRQTLALKLHAHRHPVRRCRTGVSGVRENLRCHQLVLGIQPEDDIF
jgi:hypothetical protein